MTQMGTNIRAGRARLHRASPLTHLTTPNIMELRGTIMIHVIRERVTTQQMADMMETLETYIKLAVDVSRGILAGGGEMHADCESVLLDDGSNQEEVWGADWYPSKQQVAFESLINIRPRQGNRSYRIEIPDVRKRVEEVARNLLGGVV